MKHAASILGLVLMLAACGQQQNETAAPAAPAQVAAPASLTPEQLGALGARIRKEPDRGDELLAQHGLDRQSFEKAIRAVTENADASRRYAEAYRKGSA